MSDVPRNDEPAPRWARDLSDAVKFHMRRADDDRKRMISILQEMRAERGEDRRRADEDRRRADEDRRQAREDREMFFMAVQDMHAESAHERRQLRQVLVRIERAVRQSDRHLKEILRVLRVRGNGRPGSRN